MTARLALLSPLGALVGLTLGALGGGGSILTVPLLVYVAGQQPAEATTSSLVVVGIAAATAAVRHWQRGRVRIGLGLMFGAAGIGGSVGGSALNRHLDDDVLLLAFAGLILVAAWRIAVGCPSCTRAGESAAVATEGDAAPAASARVARLAVLLAAGTAVGFLTGLFGVGGGFVVVPVLALVVGLRMPDAIGTSLLVIAVNAAVSLALRVGDGGIDWPTTVVFAGAAVVGSGFGERVADRVSPATLQRAFAAMLVIVAGYVGISAGLALT